MNLQSNAIKTVVEIVTQIKGFKKNRNLNLFDAIQMTLTIFVLVESFVKFTKVSNLKVIAI